MLPIRWQSSALVSGIRTRRLLRTSSRATHSNSMMNFHLTSTMGDWRQCQNLKRSHERTSLLIPMTVLSVLWQWSSWLEALHNCSKIAKEERIAGVAYKDMLGSLLRGKRFGEDIDEGN